MDELTMLALRARNGDRRPLEELIRHGQNDVWRLCAHLVDAASADDLTQETFLRVVRSLPAFRGESSARTWLLTIARRVCADELRGRVRRRRLIGRLGEQSRRIDAADPPAGLCEVEILVAALDPDRRAAFVLTQILGLNYEEAASVCACPVGTIRSRVARARADLLASFAPAVSAGEASGCEQ